MAIGEPLARREDERLLRGKGRFVGDHRLDGEAHLVVVRSPHAHARLVAIDARAAEAMPGVLGVLTGDQWIAEGFGELPCIWRVDSSDGTPMREAPRPAIVPLSEGRGRVRYVGDIVAAVIATDLATAHDAAEAVSVEYEPLPALVQTARALDPDAPLVHERFGTNLCFDIEFGDRHAVDAAVGRAAHIAHLELVNNRVAPCPLEPRANLGVHDAADDRYTLWTSSQNPHLVRRWLAESSLRIPEHRIRVIAPDVGGGFGQKIAHYPEEPIVLWAARKYGRPVRWQGTRSENLLEDTHGRDHVTRCRMAFDADGVILAVEVDTIAALGAYASAFGAAIPGYFYAPLLGGMYRTPAIHARIRGAYTHTTPVDAYRGAGRPEATYVLERLIEAGARDLGIDPLVIRRRNFPRPDAFPYVSPVGMRYDSGNYGGLADVLERAADIPRLREEQKALRAQGVYLGLGFAAFVDSAGGTPSRLAARLGRRVASWDNAVVRVHPTGKVSVFCGGHSHGQGHATTFAQIVADRLQRPVDDIDVVEGDTDRIPYGHGTYGSRSLAVIGVAVALAADKVAGKAAKIAAHLLECAEADVTREHGRYVVAGTDRSVPFDDVVQAAHHLHAYPEGLEPGLEETAFYDPPGRNVPAGLHLCVVRVDVETGRVTVRDFWAIDDVGRVINPLIVEGQVHGGVAQGIGQALMETVVHDAEGQLLTGSLMDYAVPRADDLPFFRTERQVTLAPDNLLGVKGVGESGSIGAPAALVNAVIDALAPLGVRHLDMPLTPLRVWTAIQAARGKAPQAAPAAHQGRTHS
jgi:carbon-monoxide dehydrogenase large subunit